MAIAGRPPKVKPYPCLFCSGATVILSERYDVKSKLIKRKRQCKVCGREQFTKDDGKP